MSIWLIFFFLFYFKGWQRQASKPFVERKNPKTKADAMFYLWENCAAAVSIIPTVTFLLLQYHLFFLWETFVLLSQLSQLSQFDWGCNLHLLSVWESYAAAVTINTIILPFCCSWNLCVTYLLSSMSEFDQPHAGPAVTSVTMDTFGRHNCPDWHLCQAKLSQLSHFASTTVPYSKNIYHNCHLRQSWPHLGTSLYCTDEYTFVDQHANMPTGES